MQGDPFTSLPAMAGQFFRITECREDYVVHCRICAAGWCVTKGKRGVPLQPFDLFRPVWHVFEKHMDALK